MKRRILIFCTLLAALGLTAFGVMNWNDQEAHRAEAASNEEIAMNEPVLGPKDKEIFTDFIYDVGPRFSPIKKTKVDGAKAVSDFLDADVVASMASVQSVGILLFENEKLTEVLESGTTAALTDRQLQLLRSFDYSTNFVVRADYRKKNGNTGILVSDYSTPHMTIVPENQAEYAQGKEVLMTYLKEESKEIWANVDPEKLQPAKLFFRVTEQGTVEVIRLDRTSGYPEVDEKMIQLISDLPGSWIPAKNAAGRPVGQELVVSFGLMGC
ncbi:energy transducer TonB [Maribacter algicola]|uniref:Energy transducer TonB n=1 Tax=Meishania litoralis TaxID=3434685 RepID=A0ACC7LKP5_9FLAO